MTVPKVSMVRGPLTAEIADIRSPVRQFLSPQARARHSRAAVTTSQARQIAQHSLTVGADSPPSTGTGRRAFTQMEQRGGATLLCRAGDAPRHCSDPGGSPGR